MSLNLVNLAKKCKKNSPIKYRSMQLTLKCFMNNIESPLKGLSKCKHGTSYVAYTINDSRLSYLTLEDTIPARAYHTNYDNPMISSLQERSIIGYNCTPTLTYKVREKYHSI